MKRPSHLLAGAIALAALLPIGCKSASPSPETSGATGDPVRDAVDAALVDLAAKIQAQVNAGWPAHMPLSSKEPKRPVVRIAQLRNNTSQRADMGEIEDRIARALLDKGHVVVAASQDERDEVMDERGYGNAAAETGPTEDVVALLLTGELADDVKEIDGERTRSVRFMVKITDTVTRGSLFMSRGEATLVTQE
jgi:hypothetical protein